MAKSNKTTQSPTTRTRTRKSPATLEPALTAATRTANLNHADIAHRAYELFLSSGAMHGRDLEHWLQAESELRGRSATTTGH